MCRLDWKRYSTQSANYLCTITYLASYFLPTIFDQRFFKKSFLLRATESHYPSTLRNSAGQGRAMPISDAPFSYFFSSLIRCWLLSKTVIPIVTYMTATKWTWPVIMDDESRLWFPVLQSRMPMKLFSDCSGAKLFMPWEQYKVCLKSFLFSLIMPVLYIIWLCLQEN